MRGDKEYAVEVIRKQLIEAKRAAIAKRAKKAMANLRKGNSKIGDVKELYKDLEEENLTGRAQLYFYSG